MTGIHWFLATASSAEVMVMGDPGGTQKQRGMFSVLNVVYKNEKNYVNWTEMRVVKLGNPQAADCKKSTNSDHVHVRMAINISFGGFSEGP